MRKLLGMALLPLILGCGGDSDTTPSIPPGAAALRTYLETGVAIMTPGLNRFDAILPFLVNPASPGASGLQFEPDTTPGAPPYSYTFAIPLDGDGDGTQETTVTGRCELTGDPATAAVGFGGTVDLDGQSVGGLGSFTGSLTFAFTDQGTELFGSGTFHEIVTGITTNIVVGPAAPLLLNVATGTANSVANACAYSLDGAVQVDAAGSSDTLSALCNFLPSQKSVQVTNVTYVDADEKETSIPNSSFVIPCGEGSIQDWVGVFLQDWSCVPALGGGDYGQAELTITVTGPSTLHIVDEDPPGSGEFNSWDATMDAGHPHIVRGSFTSGDPPYAYTEYFTWTLTPSGDGYAQVSVYLYEGGGGGGLCAGNAHRAP